MFGMQQEEDESLAQWGGYMGDATGSRRTMAGLLYIPDLAPTGSGAAGTYYPRDTREDAFALNFLGFFSDPLLAQHVGTRGTQAADQAAAVGAWSPVFRQAVGDFQLAFNLTPDGWIGPQTRTELAKQVAIKNAREVTPPSPIPIPPIPVPPTPIPVPPNPNVNPVVTKESNTGLIIGLGVAAAAVLGIGYFALSD